MQLEKHTNLENFRKLSCVQLACQILFVLRYYVEKTETYPPPQKKI